MDEQTSLIAFSENKIGGVQSFYYNLLTNDSDNRFKKRWIFTSNVFTNDARLIKKFGVCEEIFFEYGSRPFIESAFLLARMIDNKEGVIAVNHELELLALNTKRKLRKTVFFLCHDELYLSNAVKFSFLIDVFIAHNIQFYLKLRELLPDRVSDIFYLPYGIRLSNQIRKENFNRRLKLLFIARLDKKKGVYDLAKIDELLRQAQVDVSWTIIGDGPEREPLVNSLKSSANFEFCIPATTDEIFEIASQHDLFILPSYLDGVPVALLEAMSCGLVPIISRFNEGISEVVNNNNGAIVPVGDVAAFTQEIVLLNGNRILLEQRSVNARHKVVSEYEVKSRALDYYDLFKKYKDLKKNRVQKKFFSRRDDPSIPPFAKKIIQFSYVLIDKLRK